MDRKSIIVLVVCFILLMAWPMLVNKVFPPKPLPPGATNALPTSVSASNPAIITSTSAPPVLEAGAPLPPPQPAAVNTNAPEETLEVENRDARYTFTSRGGGLKFVELLKFQEKIPTYADRTVSTNPVKLNAHAVSPTLAMLGSETIQGDGVFSLTKTATGVRAQKTLTNGLTVIKDFDIGTNYLLTASVRFTNESANTLTLPAQEWVVGDAEPINQRDDGSAVGLMWHNGSKAEDVIGASYFSERGFMCTPRVPPADYRGGASNVFWAAAHNQFFALVLMPSTKEPAAQVIVRRQELPLPSFEESSHDTRVNRRPMAYQATMVYPGLTLPSHQEFQRQMTIYAGPKEYRTLATLSATLRNEVDLIMGFGGGGLSGFFGFFSKLLLLAMNWLHSALSLSYGWAIITITIIIKVLFWPLTLASIRSGKRMAALQPQVKAIQEKYKEDPMKVQQKTMALWKENKVSPMSGCLPTLVQMPVFFGFLYMIRSAIELRGATFIWVRDLSQPDTIFLIPGVNFPFNLLPLVMGATMLWQARLTPPSPGMDPAQAKMMRYMPLMFLVFLYNYSAALTLYWTVQNLLSILQTRMTRVEPAVAAATPAKPVLTPPPKKRK